MSGIGGICRLDSRSVNRADLARLANTLAHRGQDDCGLWHQGQVGLVHQMLWTTPESRQEKLPLVSPTGDLVLAADGRIDNRDELIHVLGLRHRLG